MLKFGVVGVGNRGGHLADLLQAMEDVELTAVCDPYADKMDRFESAKKYTDYKEMFANEKLDRVIVATSWDTHIKIGVEAMEHGVWPALECGGASSVDECWRLVRASEKTGIPCMFLENCNFGREEMTLLRMVQQGVFGEIVHVQGAYEHDCRSLFLIATDRTGYRGFNLYHRNGEFYPAHELGPIMKYLNINRGNRMLTLTSMASKPNPDMLGVVQGAIVNTLIKCAHGETILLTIDTTLPRPYSRGARIQGTKGIYMEDKNAIYIEGLSPNHDEWESFNKYLDDPAYEHPVWTSYRTDGIKGGHGGMDYLVLRAFIEDETPFLDVYDAATLKVITILSEESIAMGGKPVPIPDFTDGKWIKRA